MHFKVKYRKKCAAPYNRRDPGGLDGIAKCGVFTKGRIRREEHVAWRDSGETCTDFWWVT
jgi:hypothetical protein